MKNKVLFHSAVGVLFALIAVNLLWVFIWVGDGPLVVFFAYTLLAYVFLNQRRVAIRIVVAVVGLAFLVQTAELLNVGIGNLGRADRLLYLANVGLETLLFILVWAHEHLKASREHVLSVEGSP